MRPRFAKAAHERCDREQSEAERKDIQHRSARLHEQHLVEKGDQRRGNRRPLRREQHEAAEIDRDDGERTEQRARVTPAKPIVAEATDRQRDELLGQRRMHRVEQRLRQHRIMHLPRRRHVMKFVEHEFVRRGEANQQRDMREHEDHRADREAPAYRQIRRGRPFGRKFPRGGGASRWCRGQSLGPSH